MVTGRGIVWQRRLMHVQAWVCMCTSCVSLKEQLPHTSYIRFHSLPLFFFFFFFPSSVTLTPTPLTASSTAPCGAERATAAGLINIRGWHFRPGKHESSILNPPNLLLVLSLCDNRQPVSFRRPLTQTLEKAELQEQLCLLWLWNIIKLDGSEWKETE